MALQFLWIVELIKFWAEYTYKPFIGACLEHIKADIGHCKRVSLERTLWGSHIALNRKNTPWFFFETTLPRYKESQSSVSVSAENNLVLRRRPTLNQKLIENYTWIQDRDPGTGHLLVIRVERSGKIAAKPLVLLRDMKRNTQKTPFLPGVDVGYFKTGSAGINVIIRHRRHYWSRETHQFYAILPVKPKAYFAQFNESSHSAFFAPIEEELDLDDFYRTFDRLSRLPSDCPAPKGTSSSKTTERKSSNKNVNCKTANSSTDLEKLLENIHGAWKRHVWPDKKDLVFAFARVGLALGSVKENVLHESGSLPWDYSSVDDIEGGFPDEWVMPRKHFGLLASILPKWKGTEPSSSETAYDTESTDDCESTDGTEYTNSTESAISK